MHRLQRYGLPFALCALLGTASAQAAVPTILGYWLEPSGSVIRIAPCALRLCVEIAALAPGPHPTTDVHNPNEALRSRPLCGLRIGEDFVARDAQHAEGGRLYDPRNGRTYQGSMTASADQLDLRGYVGLKLFGRTATWMRARFAPASPCGAG